MKHWLLLGLLAGSCYAEPLESVEVLLHTQPEGAQVFWDGEKGATSDLKTGTPFTRVYSSQGPLHRETRGFYTIRVRKAGFRELSAEIQASQLQMPTLELDLGPLQPVTLAGWLELRPWVLPLTGTGLLAMIGGIWSQRKQARRKRDREQLRKREIGADKDSNIGRQIGRYHLLELLGTGGMARVYRAVLASNPEKEAVALKLLTMHSGLTHEARQRYYAEVRLNSRLRHPNLVLLYEPVEAAGEVGLVMELLRGRNLRQQRPRLTASLLLQIGSGLAYLHEHNIIHRDLKPDNFFLTEGGVVKIMDLGISILAGEERFTQGGAVLGTLPYMSPEQIQGKPLTYASDQYSLGVVLYEWLTGELPFQDETPRGLALQHLQVDPVPPSYLKAGLSSELDQALLRMLIKPPDQRYPTLEQAVQAVASKLPAV